MFSKLTKGMVAGSALLAMGFASAANADVNIIKGAGSTFAYPLYAKWAQTYAQQSGIKLLFAAIGSGGGIKQIEAKTVDFGASDAPLTAKELNKAGLAQFPTAMGGVVPVVDLPSVPKGKLKLSGDVLADIYLGTITHWDDPRIAAENPGMHLPHRTITTINRTDASGTTWIFTNYLSKVSSEWKAKVGNAKAVSWPAANQAGGKGNAGVASYVRRIRGAIGYVEYAYALQNHMNHVNLRNQAGNYVAPTAANFKAAAANADWEHAPGFYMVLTNQPGAKSWPITGATFVLVHKKPDDPATIHAVLKFFNWGFHHGGNTAEQLKYVPMPASVVSLIQQSWHKQIKGPNGKALWGSM